jgi:hypothetical protein
MSTEILTQEHLKSVLQYDPDTGIFVWKKKVNRRVVIGSEAGCIANGYISIRVAGRIYRAHRLAWLYMTGNFPRKEYIDHINGVRADNKWLNLREATNSENCFNSAKRSIGTSGFKGVSFCKERNSWEARAYVKRRKHFLGRYKTAELAYEAYKEFSRKVHGEFSYQGL